MDSDNSDEERKTRERFLLPEAFTESLHPSTHDELIYFPHHPAP